MTMRDVRCRIFGHHGDTADDLIYVNWLNMARSGLLALEFYTPETATWRQVGVLTALAVRNRRPLIIELVVVIIIFCYIDIESHSRAWVFLTGF